MRILVFGGPFLNAGFERLGCEVFNLGDKPGCDARRTHPLSALKAFETAGARGFKPDICLYCDSGNLPQFFDLERLPCPTAFYSIDSYCNPWHIPFGHAFDKVFVAQKDYVELFTACNVNASWLPLFFRTHRAHYFESSRDIPVVFVGTVNAPNNPGRRDFLNAFRSLHPAYIDQGDFIPLFNRSRIVLNQTAASEVNFRCFEALACGGALLMEECANGLRDLFTPGEHILPLYRRGDARQAAGIAAAALRNPAALARIARQGRKLVEEKHSDVNRAAAVLRDMLPLLREEVHKRRLDPANLARRSCLLSSAYAFLALELCNPEHARHREFYHRLALASACAA
jgi:hypothetical protein